MKRTKSKPGAARPSVHVSIDVPELEAGLRFYGEVFGFVETARPFPTMAILDANNVTVCMHAKATGSKSSSRGSELRRYERHWTPVHLDLHVEDFDAVLAKVRARGGAIENEFRTQGPKPAAFCSDPFGNGFCVIGAKKTPKQTAAKKATATKSPPSSAGAPKKPRVFAISFASVYPLYVRKAEKKGRTKMEVDEVIAWLTGYRGESLQRALDAKVDLETLFAQAPRMNPNAHLITGVVCGVRVEDVADPLMQKIRYLDKLVDELAKGKKLASILRQ